MGEENLKLIDEVKLKTDDVGVIQFTSGTTGAPKAAALTHFNMVNYSLGKLPSTTVVKLNPKNLSLRSFLYFTFMV